MILVLVLLELICKEIYSSFTSELFHKLYLDMKLFNENYKV